MRAAARFMDHTGFSKKFLLQDRLGSRHAVEYKKYREFWVIDIYFNMLGQFSDIVNNVRNLKGRECIGKMLLSLSCHLRIIERCLFILKSLD